jgi:glycosyltransferase involved in cell wall biosynthesis
MKKFIIVQGPVSTRSGYGNHTRDIVRSLIDSDKYEIQIVSVPWGNCPMTALDPEYDQDIISRIATTDIARQPDIHIQISVPNEFQAHGKYNIGITAGIETTVCAPQWIEGCNRMDKIITVSEHSKKVFQDCVFDKVNDKTKQKIGELRLEKPIEVLFEGVDMDIFHKIANIEPAVITEMKNIKEKFCFLFVGHWLKGEIGQDRKDVGMLIKVFAEAFKNKSGLNTPALILKTSGATFSIMDRDDIMNKISNILAPYGNRAPNVYLLHGDMTEDEINSLYNHPKVKAMVSLTKGEGYGRPLAEFATSEKPIITTNWSGHTDFLKEQYSILLPGKLMDVHHSAVDNHILKEGKWFTVDYSQAAKAMHDVFTNYDRYKPGAKKQGMHINENFNIKAMSDKLVEMVESGAALVPEPIALKLPQLKKVGASEAPKLKLPKLTKLI